MTFTMENGQHTASTITSMSLSPTARVQQGNGVDIAMHGRVSADVTKVLVVLQNAYDVGELRHGFNSSRWLSELRGTLSYSKIIRAIPDDFEVRWTNACRGVGQGSSSKLQPYPPKIRKRAVEHRVSSVLACGLVAEQAASEAWDGPILAIPHPACRVLTNGLLDVARALLVAGHGRMALRQRRGHVVFEELG